MGLLALAVAPAALAASRYVRGVRLLDGAFAVPAAAFVGLVAVVLARGARGRIERTLGRAGGAGAARVGRALGVLGILIGLTGALALGFFGLLTLFAS